MRYRGSFGAVVLVAMFGMAATRALAFDTKHLDRKGRWLPSRRPVSGRPDGEPDA